MANELDEHRIALARNFEQLADRVEALDYRGWEFDDFLSSPVVRLLTGGSLLAQRIAIQVGERCPINLRPVLRVPRLPSAKANGFFARGYLYAHRGTGAKRWLERATALLDRLLDSTVPGYAGHAWGNAFDFASRAGFFPAGLPTIVWTAHISKAFALGYEQTGDARYADAVVGSARFILTDLERHEDRDGVCIAYAPGRPSLVHNSNLLGAVALLRAWRMTDDPELLDVALRAFAWSRAHQRPDGSWPYGVGPEWSWVDNLHTAYVLDCLREGQLLAGEDATPTATIASTYDYWRRTFFLGDGAPRYYHNRTFPLDIQCAAQAIATLATASELDPDAPNVARRVLNWTNTHLRRPDGFYGYRRGRYFANRLASMHWGQSTMLEALGLLLDHSRVEAEA